MIAFIKIFLAHILGDFVFQPKKWVIEKETKKIASFRLYLHGFVHGGIVLLLFWDWKMWQLACIITITHIAIDILKAYITSDNTKTQWFFIDQLLHVISILAIWYFCFLPDIYLFEIIQNPQIWIYGTAIIFLMSPIGIIIQFLLSKWSDKFSGNKDESLINAGKYIGILERLFVFTFVVTGHWEAIGFLLAAKSVFRFGDLKESKDIQLTEYILIGTLMSFGIAILVGLLVLKTNSLLV